MQHNSEESRGESVPGFRSDRYVNQGQGSGRQDENKDAVALSATQIGKDATLLNCDVLEGLESLRPKSIQCVVTSPPYWGLRDYGTGTWEGGEDGCEHSIAQSNNDRSMVKPDHNFRKGSVQYLGQKKMKPFCRCGARLVDVQIGLEATIADYLAKMVEVFQAVRRVLRDDGSIWVNIGDSYLAQQGKGWNGQERMDDANLNVKCKHPEGIGPKNLLGMPWRLAFALQADGWYLRSDIIWAKPNPMPESCTDRPTKSHEHVFLLTKNPRYFYDADAVREDNGPTCRTAGSRTNFRLKDHKIEMILGRNTINKQGVDSHRFDGLGRNLRDVWTIPTQPQKDAHFATFPERLVEPCVMAGTSEKGCCPKCSAPWESVKSERPEIPDEAYNTSKRTPGDGYTNTGARSGKVGGQKLQEWLDAHPIKTTGWKPTCHCPEAEPVPCTVLDPFAGCATTGKVALALGRKFIGIELNPEYCKLAKKTLQRQESKRGFGFGALGKTVRV